jgi:hypothetical protein
VAAPGQSITTGPPLTGTSTIAQVAAWLTADGKDGAAYSSWATAAIAKEPTLTPFDALEVWLAGTDTAQAVGAAAGAAGTATGQVQTGLDAGLPGFSIPGLSQLGDFFGALTGANLWIRAAKVLVGATLVIVGIAHITGADGALAATARKVPLPV